MRTKILAVVQLCAFTVLACGSDSSSTSGNGDTGSSGGSSNGSGGATKGSGGSSVTSSGGSSGKGSGGSSVTSSGGNSGASGGAAGGSSGKGGAGGAATSSGGGAGKGSSAAGGGGGSGSSAAGGSAGKGGGGGAGTSADGGSGSGGATVGGGGSDGGAAGSTAVDGGAAAVSSSGCGNAQGPKTITANGASVSGGLSTSTRLTIQSGGKSREYIIDIPADYDPTHAYRLFFTFHWISSNDTAIATGSQPANSSSNFNATNYAFYGLHREATNAKDPAIFIAPSSDGSMWDATTDGTLFDNLYALATADLCIDTSRVFATGFSFGAMMTYAMSITRQKQLRAVVAMAPANYNLPNEPTDSNAAPIAYMGTTGMSDGTCPFVNSDTNKQGGKYCALTHAQDNGCTIPSTIPTATVGSKKYVCYDFEGCKAGYPVKVCTFDGIHQPAPVDDGNSTSDDGLKSWVPDLAWKFFTQF